MCQFSFWPLFPLTAPDFTTTPPPCEDVLPNCKNYGDDVCSNVAYADWALSNCRKFCNLCGECFSAVFAYLNVCNNNNHDKVNFCVLVSPSLSTYPVTKQRTKTQLKQTCACAYKYHPHKHPHTHMHAHMHARMHTRTYVHMFTSVYLAVVISVSDNCPPAYQP